ncbi:TetR/AcrR family transcriptional regulator [Ferrovibrio xuzhouensis]|uniref:TetR/AcrR family transcriptional regulator n=1 Tax=Ferrovibrio xuzhouensis TaxID=1576914 RepID=A0ABV7VG74_9PROT
MTLRPAAASPSADRPAADRPDDLPAGTIQDRLLDAALACFRRMGGKRTRIEDIASEAGLARTAVYRYYPNKRAIVAAMATRWLADDETRLAEIARDSGRSPAARLHAFLLADAEATRRYLTDPGRAEVLDEVMQNIAAVARQHRSHIRRHLAGLMAEGSQAGAFRPAAPERQAQVIDDLTASFHDPRLAAMFDKDSWRERAEAAADTILRSVRAR